MAWRRRRKPRSGRKPESQPANSTVAIPRIALLDFLRGVALVGMTVFHFVYDLEFFGLEDRGNHRRFHWWLLSTTVAGSFLFLSGTSLYLAHFDGIRWRRWGRRLAIIVLAAFAITLVTRFATPENYIFFGILHMIAFGNLVGLAFLRVPWWLAGAAAAAVLVIDASVAMEWLNAPGTRWLGLGSAAPLSSDYRPVFPWLAPVLLGFGAAGICHQRGWLQVLAMPGLEGGVGPLVRFLGRNSLLYYLLHQPVLLALFWTWLQFTGR